MTAPATSLTRFAFREPGRITVAGDWHGNTRWAVHVLEQAAAEGADILIHTGDFGVWHGAAGQDFLDAVSAAAARTGVPVLFIDGNHENFDLLEALPLDPDTGLRPVRRGLAHAPRGFRWTWGGLRFLALGGATSLDRPSRTTWVSWWPQEEITAAQAQHAIDGGAVDVMFTHDCPAGVAVPNIPPDSWWPPAEMARANHHRAQLRHVVEQVRPAHLFHGHFHSRYDATLTLADGATTRITGLDCDGTGPGAWVTLDVADLAAQPAVAG